MSRTLAAVLLVAVVAFISACASTPITGRSRLPMMLPLSTELQLGMDAYAEAKSTENLITSGPDYEMVQRIGERVAVVANEMIPDPAQQFEWEFILIDDPQMANAWALPGGKTAVYTGLLPITQDEDGLAAVMGHEIAHAVLRHGGERMQTQGLLSLGLAGVSIGLGDMDPGSKQATMEALGMASSVGLALPFSRAHESEADEVGLYFAAGAGYDPRAAIGLWERMAARSGGEAPPELLSTHPSHSTRIQDLQMWMPAALDIYRKNGGK